MTCLSGKAAGATHVGRPSRRPKTQSRSPNSGSDTLLDASDSSFPIITVSRERAPCRSRACQTASPRNTPSTRLGGRRTGKHEWRGNQSRGTEVGVSRERCRRWSMRGRWSEWNWHLENLKSDSSIGCNFEDAYFETKTRGSARTLQRGRRRSLRSARFSFSSRCSTNSKAVPDFKNVFLSTDAPMLLLIAPGATHMTLTPNPSARVSRSFHKPPTWRVTSQLHPHSIAEAVNCRF